MAGFLVVLGRGGMVDVETMVRNDNDNDDDDDNEVVSYVVLNKEVEFEW